MIPWKKKDHLQEGDLHERARKELQAGDRVFVGIDLHKKKWMSLSEQLSSSFSAAAFLVVGKHYSGYWIDTKGTKLKQFMKLRL